MEADDLRYSCQIALPGFGAQGQERLRNSRVLIVGAGGLGCPAAQYLAAAGVGKLTIVDNDVISVSNLHRQILYSPADAGKQKVLVAAERLRAQNPAIEIISVAERVSSDNVLRLFQDPDLIIDATDNFETRYLLNDAAVLSSKPLVYGAIYQYEGQVSVWNAPNTDGTRTPNYRDLFPQVDATQVPNCADGGVSPPLAGIIGCMQANEAIKYLVGDTDILAGKVLVFDARSMQSRVLGIGKVTRTNITGLPKTEKAETISATNLKAALAAGNVELVDIRSSAEHDDFNIGGKHIPAYKLESSLPKLDTSKTIVLYCTIGLRSADAVKQLRQSHPELNVVSLEGGLKGWR